MDRSQPLTEEQLAQIGIILVSYEPLTLQCEQCRAEWHVQYRPNGRLPYLYWRCDMGCNRNRHFARSEKRKYTEHAA